MPFSDFISKDQAKRFATRAAQTAVESGTVRSRLSRYGDPSGGSSYFAGRGYKGFRSVPPRTQAQQAVWGIPGPIGATRYSGFGQLQLDRGFRSHTNQPYGLTPPESGSPSEAPFLNTMQAGWAHHHPQRPLGLGSGPIIDTTAREVPPDDGLPPDTSPSSPSPWAMGPVGTSSPSSGGRGIPLGPVVGAATAVNDRFNNTLSRPVVGRAVRAGMSMSPTGRAALFANSAMNKRKARPGVGQQELPF